MVRATSLPFQLTSTGTSPEPASTCPPSSLCCPGTALSVPATVCYEGEGDCEYVNMNYVKLRSSISEMFNVHVVCESRLMY